MMKHLHYRRLLPTLLESCAGTCGSSSLWNPFAVLAHHRFNSSATSSDADFFDLKGMIEVKNPIVELRGDDMAQVLSDMVKDQLLNPYLKLPLKTYDLSLGNRKETKQQVLFEAIDGIRQHKIGVKIPTLAMSTGTLTNDNRRAWRSATVTLREHLDGAIFLEPIVIDNIPRLINSWRKPIIVSRHAFGDHYMNQSLEVKQRGKVKLVFTPDDGSPSVEKCIHEFEADNPGVCIGMYNTRRSIASFARCCFLYCLANKLPLYLSIKTEILETYDGMFKSVFDSVYEEFEPKFKQAGIWYDNLSADEMVVKVLRSEGGFVWACKNYDGDVNSDLVTVGFGSGWLMTTTLMCPDNVSCVTEPAHGPLSEHYKQHIKGIKTSTNPLGTIFAWTRALQRRAQADGNQRLEQFCYALEAASVETVEAGVHTVDLVVENLHKEVPPQSTQSILDEIIKLLKIKLVTHQTKRSFAAAASRLAN